MEAYEYHVYICNQQKPEGIPGCAAHGAEKIIDFMRREVAKQGLNDKVQITTSGSLGLCEWGPNMVVYPEGTWYCGIKPEDVPEIVSQHFGQGQPVERLVRKDANELKAEIEKNKSKMMAGMKAREEAGVMPDDLAGMIQGFRDSRIILTAVELDLFTTVGEGASAKAVAAKIGTDERATGLLMNALVSLGLLIKTGDNYKNSANASKYFVEGAPHDSRASLGHTINLWQRWGTLTACVKEGTSVSQKDFTDRPEGWANTFIAAMHKNTLARAPLVVRAVGTEGVHKMLDVGGGSGGYSVAFAKASPSLKSVVFDLPAVIQLAQKYIADAGLSDRVTTETGDMRTDDLGNGYDMVFISAICHMFDPEGNKKLFKKAFKALTSKGRIVIQDFILNPDKASPKTAAIFAINMLVGTKAGGTYTESEYTSWLKDAKFNGIKRLPLPGPTGIIVAEKP